MRMISSAVLPNPLSWFDQVAKTGRFKSLKHLHNIPSGTKVYFGAPAKPMLKDISDALGHLVCTLPEVAEAHLPQCYIPGVMDAPAQVLVLILTPNANVERIFQQITGHLPDILSPGMPLDVLPLFADNQLVGNIRAAHCRLFSLNDGSHVP